VAAAQAYLPEIPEREPKARMAAVSSDMRRAVGGDT
jgi:hypothetical protein